MQESNQRPPESFEQRLTYRARELRRNSTVPERRLWQALRNRRLAGLKFLRQTPLEGYIVDFLCREIRLIVEVDGDSHIDRASADAVRASCLTDSEYRLLRVSNDDVLQNLEGVLFAIVREAGLNPVAWRDGQLRKKSE